ncbi:MAG: hypothetical protein NTY48_05430 [Candidatus Diapherotrites archaeon]|nr:hypothetical protein [Candidatus Diapherotrites archaeon]
MVAGVIFSPTRAFENAFNNSFSFISVLVPIFTSLLLALVVFGFIGDAFLAGFFFITGFIQWLIFILVIWFFEFVHIKKRAKLKSTEFRQFVSVVSKLWNINLVGSLLMALIVFVVFRLSQNIVFVLFPIIIVVMVILAVGWIVASGRMLKVVFGISGLKLLVNWILIMAVVVLLNSFVSVLLSRILF